QPLRGRVDQLHSTSRFAQERRRERERVRRLGRAKDFFTFLAAALSSESNAVDERRVDKQRAATKHLDVTHRTTVNGIARLTGRGTPGPNGSASGIGDNS